ncbi:MAG: LysM peptidoglycan-binding domain-containing protein [Alphaproteobacteria bacterium]|nr:LysM peptidoglycan-binding domain-containing protein [Alphaproteobacteria bacterium]
MADGYSHGVGYAYNIDGEVLFRQEGVAYPVQAAPIDLFFYFGGKQIGNISNNGTSNVGYVASITQQTAKPGNGFFTDGATSGTSYADFDQSYNAVNGLTCGQSPSTYTVQAGDTLQSIALQIWGDSNFWYLLADANGLDPSAQLDPGITLVVPNDIANSQNNTSTYRPYDPNAHIGDISPTHPPKPQPHHGCGILGEILLAVIAVVVAYFTAGAALGAMGVTGAAGATSTSALMAAASFPEAVAAGAIGGAAGSIVSQGVGLATGIQKSFNWGAVGMAALGGAIGAGLGPNALTGANGAFGSLGTVGGAIARGVLGNVLTQGIGVATGLQKSFDWAGVAAAGVAAGVGAYVGQQLHLDNPQMPSSSLTFVSGMAGLIVGAATRSLVSGTDFGDNILKGLPDVIGQTVGSVMQNEIQQQDQSSTTDDTTGATVTTTPVEEDDLPPILGTKMGQSASLAIQANNSSSQADSSSSDSGSATGGIPVGQVFVNSNGNYEYRYQDGTTKYYDPNSGTWGDTETETVVVTGTRLPASAYPWAVQQIMNAPKGTKWTVKAYFLDPLKYLGHLSQPINALHTGFKIYKDGVPLFSIDAGPDFGHVSLSEPLGPLIFDSGSITGNPTSAIPEIEIPAPQGTDQATFAERLLIEAYAYDGSVPYSLPMDGVRDYMQPDSDSYNSNSFAASLLIQAGATDDIGLIQYHLAQHDWAGPGLENPLPSRYFHY